MDQELINYGPGEGQVTGRGQKDNEGLVKGQMMVRGWIDYGPLMDQEWIDNGPAKDVDESAIDQ